MNRLYTKKKNGGLILSLVQNINYKCRQLAVSLCVCGACIASLDRLSNARIKITKQQHTHTAMMILYLEKKKCHFTTIELKHGVKKKSARNSLSSAFFYLSPFDATGFFSVAHRNFRGWSQLDSCYFFFCLAIVIFIAVFFFTSPAILLTTVVENCTHPCNSCARPSRWKKKQIWFDACERNECYWYLDLLWCGLSISMAVFFDCLQF